MAKPADGYEPLTWPIEVPNIEDIEIQVLAALAQAMTRISVRQIPTASDRDACKKRVAWWFQQRFGEGDDS